jgi:hypothetical protein
MHLDEYAVNQGRRQTGSADPPIAERYPSPLIYFTGGEAYIRIADDTVGLRAAVRAAIRLADTVERVRAAHLARVECAANAAFRKRWHLPDDFGQAES